MKKPDKEVQEYQQAIKQALADLKKWKAQDVMSSKLAIDNLKTAQKETKCK